MKLFLLLLFAFSPGYADEYYRPERYADLPSGTIGDKMVRVKGAKVAWADFAALRRDFPDLRPLTDTQISTWILDRFGYISEAQLELNDVRQTPIPVEKGKTKFGMRPVTYDRAAVEETGFKNGGLIDLKGAGHRKGSPSLLKQIADFKAAAGNWDEINKIHIRNHTDGLMSLGEAIAEVTRQNAAQKLFDLHHATGGKRLQTVESYFIISLPFEILKGHGTKVPAALYGRQANAGRPNGLKVPDKIYIDSEGAKQASEMGAAVDFGGVQIKDPRLADRFGMLDSSSFGAQYSKPWAYGHDTARAFYYRNDTFAIYRHLEDDMLKPILEEWRTLPVARELERFCVPVPRDQGPAPKPFLAKLDEALGAADPELRLSAVRTLKLRNGPGDLATLKLLQKALSDGTPEVVKESVEAISYHRHPGALEVMDWIFEHRYSEPFTRFRDDTGRYLGSGLAKRKGPESIPLLKKLLSSGSAPYYKNAALALRDLPATPEAFRLWEDMLSHPADDVRFYSAFALAQRNDTRALGILRRLLANGNPEHREAILKGISEAMASSGMSCLKARILHLTLP
ncbi:MAG TPA: hypothetical protein VJB59_14650 [Bdellovibrionota bacterium]|nr:hypothetical protein [Bdellovibrionota bacterium]